MWSAVVDTSSLWFFCRSSIGVSKPLFLPAAPSQCSTAFPNVYSSALSISFYLAPAQWLPRLSNFFCSFALTTASSSCSTYLGESVADTVPSTSAWISFLLILNFQWDQFTLFHCTHDIVTSATWSTAKSDRKTDSSLELAFQLISCSSKNQRPSWRSFMFPWNSFAENGC